MVLTAGLGAYAALLSFTQPWKSRLVNVVDNTISVSLMVVSVSAAMLVQSTLAHQEEVVAKTSLGCRCREAHYWFGGHYGDAEALLLSAEAVHHVFVSLRR